MQSKKSIEKLYKSEMKIVIFDSIKVKKTLNIL